MEWAALATGWGMTLKITGYTIVMARAGERFRELSAAVTTATIPGFLNEDRAVVRYWSCLTEDFPDYRFCLVDEAGGAVERGHSIPLAFNGGSPSLPDGGVDGAPEEVFSGHTEGRRPTVYSALYIVISDRPRSKGLSYRMLIAMKQVGREQGFSHHIAPVRPSLKSRYPHTAIEEYCRWQDAEGYPFDPWLRAHVRVGGEVLHPCARSMMVNGPRRQWEERMGKEFCEAGSYMAPGPLVPVTFGKVLSGNLVRAPSPASAAPT